MGDSPRYRLFPTAEQQDDDCTVQSRSHRIQFNDIPEDTDTLRHRVLVLRDTIIDPKTTGVTSPQLTSTRQCDRKRPSVFNRTSPISGELTDARCTVRSLNWKVPRECRSFTYRRSGFELDEKSGPNEN
ncbi:MAG: hypothetical protein J07HQW1_00858 [Haloquadratum walsbyi J07HQW1]|uniref:Uncharacterized protein n=1 Tax=Haloquadratum walsbyi J07HQW1 TaxID=1238424 RepID=U1N2U7_9EURY|nr:MAG: hypothetical protein J07HQW1_00858 [Haloquadratum walsbyi J07HQW1]